MSLLPMAEYLGVSSGTNPPTNDTYCISTKKTVKRIKESWWFVAEPNFNHSLVVLQLKMLH